MSKILKSSLTLGLAALISTSLGTKAEAVNVVNLTQGQWDVTGFDTANWNGSDLFFTTQIPNGADSDIAGYFDWYSNGIYRGRELFSGTYTFNGFLNFTGFQLINPISIQLSNYQAEVLSPSQLGNGTWGARGITGIWSATNPTAIVPAEPDTVTVPEPSFMLSFGMFVLAGSILKQHTKRKNPLTV